MSVRPRTVSLKSFDRSVDTARSQVAWNLTLTMHAPRPHDATTSRLPGPDPTQHRASGRPAHPKPRTIRCDPQRLVSPSRCNADQTSGQMCPRKPSGHHQRCIKILHAAACRSSKPTVSPSEYRRRNFKRGKRLPTEPTPRLILTLNRDATRNLPAPAFPTARLTTAPHSLDS